MSATKCLIDRAGGMQTGGEGGARSPFNNDALPSAVNGSTVAKIRKLFAISGLRLGFSNGPDELLQQGRGRGRNNLGVCQAHGAAVERRDAAARFFRDQQSGRNVPNADARGQIAV